MTLTVFEEQEMSGHTLELQESRDLFRSDLESQVTNVPYPDRISQDEHRKRKGKIEDFLLKEGIVSREELPHIGGTHLTQSQWNMMKDNPEDYWLVVYANGLMEDEYQKKLGTFIKASDNNEYQLFLYNQNVWFAVHRHVANEGFNDHVRRRYRAFATLKKMVFPEEFAPYSWGQEVIDKYHDKTHTYSGNYDQKTYDKNPNNGDFIH